jgi:hypothetical protein
MAPDDVDDRLGSTDCERIRPGLIAQPVNTITSLAFVAAAATGAAREGAGSAPGGDASGTTGAGMLWTMHSSIRRPTAWTWEAFVRGAISAYYGFLASEHDNWMARRPAGEAGLTLMGETPEMSAVFEEVRRSIIDEAERGGARGVDADYLAAACIGLAREVGQKMLARRPIDPAAATDFAVALILRGTAGLAEAAR